MAPKETMQSIRDWASSSFPDEFARFDTYINTASFTFSKFHVQHDTELSANKVDGVQVGSIDADNKPVFAWHGTEGITLGHKSGEGKVQPHQDFITPHVDFSAPFSWLGPTHNEVGLAHLEALIRYLILARIRQDFALRHNIDFFKEHFKGACQELVEHIASAATHTPIRTRGQTAAQARVRTPVQTPTGAPPKTPVATPMRPPLSPLSKPMLFKSEDGDADIIL